jgi:type III pantothenate kinase
MARIPRQFDPHAPVIVVDIGNTTTGIATWANANIRTALHTPTNDDAAFEESLKAHIQACPGGQPAAVVVGSVVSGVLDRLRETVEKSLQQQILVVGEDIELPIDVAVRDRKAIGVDRVCAAAAAYEQIKAACAIVDFGTAVTVDVVDDDGVLLGGAILPGIDLQFRALHEHTAALPVVSQGVPELPFGRDTVEAIQTGVCRGIAGAVRGIVEGYATHLRQWPQVVATGGDTEFMAPLLDFADSLVQDLTLRGVGLAYDRHLSELGI